MVRRIVVTLVVFGLLSSLWAGTVSASQDKVTVCHKPGTPAEMTLEVAPSAVDAHLGHGDHTGACGPQVSDGCAAINALVPDPQTDPYNYFFGVTGLTFLPGEIIHADITITWIFAPAIVEARVNDGTGAALAIDSHSETASVDYTVVAGDDADGASVSAMNSIPIELVSVHFSCTAAG